MFYRHLIITLLPLRLPVHVWLRPRWDRVVPYFSASGAPLREIEKRSLEGERHISCRRIGDKLAWLTRQPSADQ
jgi:hypothetical protein